MPLAWIRPSASEYPKIWHTFSVSGENYEIQDLPLSRTQDAVAFMINHCIKDDPLCIAYHLHDNPFIIDQFKEVYATVIIPQRVTLVCFKEGSNEILGMNLNYVSCNSDTDSKGDTLQNVRSKFHQLCRICTDRKYTLRSFRESQANLTRHRNLIEFMREETTLEEGETPLEVNEVMSSCGLGVAPEYRNRGIGTALLKARKPLCKELNIKLTDDIFTSDTSDRCAEKAGFKLQRKLTYDKIREVNSQLDLPKHVGSDSISFRTMLVDED